MANGNDTPLTMPAPEEKIVRSVKTPDGKIMRVRVPKTATDAQIAAFAQQQYMATPPSRAERFGRGIATPIEGGAELLERALPASVNEKLRAINNLIAQKTGIFEELPPGGVSELQRRREDIYQQRRGPGAGIDVYRGLGEAVPLVAAGIPATIGEAVVGGAVAGGAGALTEPTYGPPETFAEQKGGQVMGGLIGGGIFGGVGGLASRAVTALGRYLAREFPENVMTQAVQAILRRIEREQKAGGPSATDMIKTINAASAKGRPLTLADIGGEDVQALLGYVYRKPEQSASRAITKRFLETRDKGAAARLDAQIKQFIGGGQSSFATIKGLQEARSTAARPIWEQAMELQGVWSPRLQEFFSNPSVRKGLQHGFEIERDEALAEGRAFEPGTWGVDLDSEGNVLLRQGVPNMRALHMAKVGLDKMVEEQRDITGRLSVDGVRFEKLRNAYRDAIDQADGSGLYKQARAIWAGPSASIDAVKAGKGLFQKVPDEITAEFSRIEPGNQDFYRLGVADAITERLQKVGISADEAKAIIKNDWVRRQLQPIFRSGKDFDEFIDAVTDEMRMYGTKQATLGGPATAARIAEDTSAEVSQMQQRFSIGEKFFKGHWVQGFMELYRHVKDLGMMANPKLNEQLAKILLQNPIAPGSELERRLTGTFGATAPQISPYLGGPAAALAGTGQAISPAAGAAIGGEVGEALQ